MIKRIVSHRWIRPRYSSVLMEITPLPDDGMVTLCVNGREPTTTPKSVSISAASFEGATFDLLVESIEMVDVTMTMVLPLQSNMKFLRFDFFGTMIPVEGTVKHQVYVTVDPAKNAAAAMGNGPTVGGENGSGLQGTSTMTAADVASWLNGSSVSRSTPSPRIQPVRSHDHGTPNGRGVPSSSRFGLPDTTIYSKRQSPPRHATTNNAATGLTGTANDDERTQAMAVRYAQAYTVSDLREEVRDQRNRLESAEKQLQHEKHYLNESMANIQTQLDQEHARQMERSGLYHQRRMELISSLRSNVRTPDVNALSPPLAAVK